MTITILFSGLQWISPVKLPLSWDRPLPGVGGAGVRLRSVGYILDTRYIMLCFLNTQYLPAVLIQQWPMVVYQSCPSFCMDTRIEIQSSEPIFA